MDNDNLYPNQGEYFTPSVPEEQIKEHDVEKAEVLNAAPILKELVEHFKTRIKFRDSIKAVKVDISEKPELHQKTCAVNDMLADALKEELNFVEALISEYSPK